METKTPTTGASSIKTFTVPAEMLQMFRADPRVLGHKHLPAISYSTRK